MLFVYVPAAIYMRGLIGWAAVVGTPRHRHRRRAGRWRALWNRPIIWLLRYVLGVRLTIRVPPGFNAVTQTRPVIFVANHRSTLDIFVINEVARHMGLRDVRWVLKKPLRRRGGIIGRSCNETECAFVQRGHTLDFAEVERAALTARADGASLSIFPEGTRFRPHRARTFQHVLDPRPNGLRHVVEAMPGYAIASVTLNWDTGAARTILDNASISGSSLVADVSLHRIRPDQVETWLATEWAAKDRRLSSETRQIDQDVQVAQAQ